MDVTFVGLRKWISVGNRTLGRYKVGLSFGDLLLKSGLSSKAYGNSVNLLDPFKSGYVDLPEQFDYWPAIFIKHIDCSPKLETVIGSAIVTQPSRYFVNEPSSMRMSQTNIVGVEPENIARISENQPLLSSAVAALLRANHSKNSTKLSRFSDIVKAKMKTTFRRVHMSQPDVPRRMLASSSGFTWWTKYYNSIKHFADYDATQKHRLRIFDSELENQQEFHFLRDWSDCVDMLKSSDKITRKPVRRKAYAQVKIDVQVRRCPDTFRCYSLNK